MDKKTIIAVIGKTSSGKDTVAKVLNEKYGIPSVVWNMYLFQRKK